MAYTYGFYDSLNGDRKYNATQWSSVFDGVINDGIFASVGNALAVTATGTNMVLTIGSGRAWFDHTWILEDGDANSPTTFTWDVAHDLAPEPLLDRIDAVVIETNSNPSVRANCFKVVKGTPASEPEKPELTSTTYIHQYALAYVTVVANTTAITQANVENARGTTATPFVTGILEVLDSNTLLTQWAADYVLWKAANSADFNTWFATLQQNLSPMVTATTTITSGTVTVNGTTFLTKLSTFGNYVFTYDGTNWTYNSVAVTLSEYGLAITAGTPASGNTITVTVADCAAHLEGQILALQTRATTDEANIANNAIGISANSDDIDDLKTVRTVSIPTSGWSSAAPYTQTVSVSGMSDSDSPIISLYIPSGTTDSVAQQMQDAYSAIGTFVTADDSMTLTAYGLKPYVDLQILVKGV